MSWSDIGRRLKKDRRAVERAHDRAVLKIPREGEYEPSKSSIQVREPEKVAQFVNEMTPADDSHVSASAIARRLGLPHDAAMAVAREIRSVYFPTKIEARNVKLERLKDLWSMKAEEALAAITPAKIAESSARDLGVVAGIATDKLLVLRGQPTQIVRNEADRTKIDVLARAFMAECERRGYDVKTDVSTGEVDLIFKRGRNE
jgi:hypothetical protein